MVLPTTMSDPATRNRVQYEFIITLKQFPEFTTDAYINKSFVLGVFSSLGEPIVGSQPICKKLYTADAQGYVPFNIHGAYGFTLH